MREDKKVRIMDTDRNINSRGGGEKERREAGT